MKTIGEYLSMPYRMEIVPDSFEGGFAVSFPELPGCLTSGETMEKALENAADAKKAWLEAALEEQLAIPEPGDPEGRCIGAAGGRFRYPEDIDQFDDEVASLFEDSEKEGIFPGGGL